MIPAPADAPVLIPDLADRFDKLCHTLWTKRHLIPRDGDQAALCREGHHEDDIDQFGRYAFACVALLVEVYTMQV